MRILKGPVKVEERPGGARRLLAKSPLGEVFAFDLSAEECRAVAPALKPAPARRKQTKGKRS